VVYGMPKAAVDRGYAVRIVGLESIASTLITQCAPEGSAHGDAKSGNGIGGKAASAGQN